jgi:hypothetical protein
VLTAHRSSPVQGGDDHNFSYHIYHIYTIIIYQPSSGITSLMPDEHPLTLRQANQARTDFAAIESNLECIMSQLARVPTRKQMAG